MYAKGILIKKYAAQSGESIHGNWRSIDVVVKTTQVVNNTEMNDYIPIRFRGEMVTVAEAIPEGADVDVVFKIDADYRISKNGNTYLTVKDFVFSGWSITKG